VGRNYAGSACEFSVRAKPIRYERVGENYAGSACEFSVRAKPIRYERVGDIRGVPHYRVLEAELVEVGPVT
jgi:hypothetical protein